MVFTPNMSMSVKTQRYEHFERSRDEDWFGSTSLQLDR